MKKIVSAVVAAAMVAALAISLAACNDKKPVDSQNGTTAPAGVTQEVVTKA